MPLPCPGCFQVDYGLSWLQDKSLPCPGSSVREHKQGLNPTPAQHGQHPCLPCPWPNSGPVPPFPANTDSSALTTKAEWGFFKFPFFTFPFFVSIPSFHRVLRCQLQQGRRVWVGGPFPFPQPCGVGNTQSPPSVPPPRDLGVQGDMEEDVAVFGGTTALPAPQQTPHCQCWGARLSSILPLLLLTYGSSCMDF